MTMTGQDGEATGEISGSALPSSKPVYFGDMDEVMHRVAQNIPFADTEMIYQWELETQRKVYLGVMVLGSVMLAYGLLLKIGL